MQKHLCPNQYGRLDLCVYCTARAAAAIKGDDALDLFDLLFEAENYPFITFIPK